MSNDPRSITAPKIKVSLRLDLPQGGRIGPGQIRLLQAIDALGSLRRAAESLNMSYPKALKLSKALNDNIDGGAVRLAHGGSGGGGASLTANGQALIALYRQVETATRSNNEAVFDALSALLRSPD